MMTSEEILSFLKSRKQELSIRFSVRSIGLFGSVLHETSREKSDLDILVELDDPTFDHYMDLKFYLEERLRMPVDLVLADSLKARLKPIIMREAAYA